MRWPRRSRRTALLLALSAGLAGCSTLPLPDPDLVETDRHPKASVSGVVVDSRTGEPVAGVEVHGLPRGGGIPWEAPSVTDSRGSFTLHLATPAEYSFLIRWRGVTVVTGEKDDPALVSVHTKAGEKIGGVVLKFSRERFERALAVRQ